MRTDGAAQGAQQPRFLPVDRQATEPRAWRLPNLTPRFSRVLSNEVQARHAGRASTSGVRQAQIGDARGAGFQELIASAARQHGVNPALISAVIDSESGFNPQAVSSAGAKGLMQLMDSTARGLGVTDPFDATQNVMGGTQLLRQLLDRYKGDVRLALAAYNAGPATVDRFGGVPPYSETQQYVPKVLAAMQRHSAASTAFRPGSQGSETWR